MPDLIIEHQPANTRFYTPINAEEAVLKYRLVSGNTIDFYQTFVPHTARGKGIAEKLVRKGLKWANEQGYNITASCWYVEKFLT